MGGAKKAQMEEEEGKEAAWAHVCADKGFSCSRCSNAPPFVEREMFFDTGMCSFCVQVSKNISLRLADFSC